MTKHYGWVCDPRTEVWTNVVAGDGAGACHKALNRWVKANKPRLRDNMDLCITQGSYPEKVDRSMYR